MLFVHVKIHLSDTWPYLKIIKGAFLGVWEGEIGADWPGKGVGLAEHCILPPEPKHSTQICSDLHQ